MDLADRLRRLRGTDRSTDQSDPAPSAAPGATLAERLQRLGVGRTGSGAGRAPDEAALADTLGATRFAPGVLLLERRLSARLRHGQTLLGCAGGLAVLPWGPGPTRPGAGGAPRRGARDRHPDAPIRSGAAGPESGSGTAREPGSGTGWETASQAGGAGSPVAEGAPGCPPLAPPWLCLDTETSGLAGGTGTWAWLAGLLRPADGGWVLRQYLLARLDAEPAYLQALAAELAAPARLVTYNGRTFDAPLLAARFRLAGWPDPLDGLPHLDLLAPVRRAFGRVWPDCRLATAEERLLGVRRADDLPGAAAPAAWLGWLRRGETGPLVRVLRHNRDDLLSLACLLPALDRAYRDPTGAGADPRAVAAAHQARGDLHRALAILVASQRALDPAGLRDLAGLHRRTGDWGRALAIWESLAAGGDPQARAALARYHEHRTGDLALALALADALPPGPERERRCRRLSAKLQRAGGTLDLEALGAGPGAAGA